MEKSLDFQLELQSEIMNEISIYLILIKNRFILKYFFNQGIYFKIYNLLFQNIKN